MSDTIAAAPPGHLRVLVIDDEPATLRAVAGILRIHGFRTLTAESGKEGSAIARKERPDLIICDVTMPGMDGYDVLRELRKDPGTAIIPFIFVSGNRDEDFVRQGMGLGADDYLLKPFTPEQILESVQARIERHRLLSHKMETLRRSLHQAVPQEFFDPLNAILGFSTLLLDNLRAGMDVPREEIEDCVGSIHAAGEDLRRIASNYALFTDLLADADKRDSAPALPPEWTDTMARDVRQQAIGTGRMKDLRYSFEKAPVAFPLEDLRKIIHELLRKAFAFSEPGDAVKITGIVEPERYLIMVRDHGPGMSREQIAAIVGATTDEGDAVPPPRAGSGLGLAICRLLLARHFGSLAIEPNLEAGVTVHVSLPIASA